MGLNTQKGNMYDFITHTWNIVKGECPHGCTYCYMKRFGKQNPPRFDEKELRTDLGENNFIFVGSSCDMFAEGIPPACIRKTLEHCKKFNNSYLFQTKNPSRLLEYSLPEKSVVCTTIETNRWYGDIMQDSPDPYDRMDSMIAIDLKKYVTIEPIMDFDLDSLVGMIAAIAPHQVNIGADSQNKNLPEPDADKVRALIVDLELITTVKKKSNLKRLLK